MSQNIIYYFLFVLLPMLLVINLWKISHTIFVNESIVIQVTISNKNFEQNLNKKNAEVMIHRLTKRQRDIEEESQSQKPREPETKRLTHRDIEAESQSQRPTCLWGGGGAGSSLSPAAVVVNLSSDNSVCEEKIR